MIGDFIHEPKVRSYCRPACQCWPKSPIADAAILPMLNAGKNSVLIVCGKCIAKLAQKIIIKANIRIHNTNDIIIRMLHEIADTYIIPCRIAAVFSRLQEFPSMPQLRRLQFLIRIIWRVIIHYDDIID